MVLKNIAKQRVSTLEKWHIETMDKFINTLSDSEKSTLVHGFTNGLSLNGGAIPNAGAIVSLDLNDAIFVTNIINILSKSPKFPETRYVYRFMHMTEPTQIFAKDSSSCSIPLNINAELPHLFPFSTTLREGYAMHALELINRNKGLLKQTATKVNAPCCLLRIRVPKGYPAFFIGPTPMASQQSIERIERTLLKKEKQEYEILLHPATLQVSKLKTRNICTTIDQIPEYARGVPDFKNLRNHWCEIPIYECEIKPIDLSIIVCSSTQISSYIANQLMSKEIFITSPTFTKDIYIERIKHAIMNGEARSWDLQRLSLPNVICEYKDIQLNELLNNSEVTNALIQMTNVMTIINKLFSKTVPDAWLYPVLDITTAIREKDILSLRKYVARFLDDIENEYMGLSFLFKKEGELPLVIVLDDLEAVIENEDPYDIEVGIANLNEYINHNRFLVTKFSNHSNNNEKLLELTEELKTVYNDICRRLKKPANNLKIELLYPFRYAGRSGRLQISTNCS